jgi:hypothetical protein
MRRRASRAHRNESGRPASHAGSGLGESRVRRVQARGRPTRQGGFGDKTSVRGRLVEAKQRPDRGRLSIRCSLRLESACGSVLQSIVASLVRQ